MAFQVGEKAIFTSPKGHQKEVEILRRAIDYERGFIDEFNEKGNFDYYVSVINISENEEIFCKKSELSRYE
jgi:hypothetical protein